MIIPQSNRVGYYDNVILNTNPINPDQVPDYILEPIQFKNVPGLVIAQNNMLPGSNPVFGRQNRLSPFFFP